MSNQNKTLRDRCIDDMLEPQVNAFPYMFAGQSLEMGMSAGWYAPFAKLCADIDATLGETKHGFHWIQLKEKFGQPRWYWEMESDGEADDDGESESQGDFFLDIRLAGSPASKDQPAQSAQCVTYRREVPGELRHRIRTLVDTATAECDGRCMGCGEPGSIRTINGWRQLLCETHAKQSDQDGHSTNT